MNLRAVLFDLDGTLVDLRSVYVASHLLAAREILGVDLGEERVLELMATGAPIRAHMAMLNGDHADVLADTFIGHYRAQRENLARPFPHVTELLDRLREQGDAVAVVTSKLREDAEVELDATGLAARVDALVAFEDTDEHKPAPAPQLEALRRVRRQRGVGVGDLPTDVISARAAGLTAIGVTWGYGMPEALIAAGAAFVCEDVSELEQALR